MYHYQFTLPYHITFSHSHVILILKLLFGPPYIVRLTNACIITILGDDKSMGGGVVSINEVALHRAQLLLGWVTVWRQV